MNRPSRRFVAFVLMLVMALPAAPALALAHDCCRGTSMHADAVSQLERCRLDRAAGTTTRTDVDAGTPAAHANRAASGADTVVPCAHCDDVATPTFAVAPPPSRAPAVGPHAYLRVTHAYGAVPAPPPDRFERPPKLHVV